ncbi:MAG: 2-dehydropantoate 2-reductase N-terminal domain-containing protein, partial [Dehalococcoidia bacterium]|nr:2-dehydropantoate 2-reductase N-terminal domain-containing protein [Dehalococcoidia bacterium]
MRIGIMGAGGIGSVVGGLLSEGGHDVTLIDQWWEHIEKIKADGLVVEHQDTEVLTHPKAI